MHRPLEDSSSTSADTAAALIEELQGTEDLYAVVGVPAGCADAREVKRAFRARALALHPDKCTLPGAEAAFQKLSLAASRLLQVGATWQGAEEGEGRPSRAATSGIADYYTSQRAEMKQFKAAFDARAFFAECGAEGAPGPPRATAASTAYAQFSEKVPPRRKDSGAVGCKDLSHLYMFAQAVGERLMEDHLASGPGALPAGGEREGQRAGAGEAAASEEERAAEEEEAAEAALEALRGRTAADPRNAYACMLDPCWGEDPSRAAGAGAEAAPRAADMALRGVWSLQDLKNSDLWQQVASERMSITKVFQIINRNPDKMAQMECYAWLKEVARHKTALEHRGGGRAAGARAAPLPPAGMVPDSWRELQARTAEARTAGAATAGPPARTAEPGTTTPQGQAEETGAARAPPAPAAKQHPTESGPQRPTKKALGDLDSPPVSNSPSEMSKSQEVLSYMPAAVAVLAAMLAAAVLGRLSAAVW